VETDRNDSRSHESELVIRIRPVNYPLRFQR